MRYRKFSELVVLPKIEGEEKLNAEEYCDQILDKDLFDFWLMSMEELEDILVLRDGVPYYRSIASVRHRQYEEDDLSSWRPGIWPANPPGLNPLENL